MTGEVIAGRFEVGEEIGKTRAFREYQARDQQLNRAVSVKVLRVRRRPEPPVLARLLKHARDTIQMSHPRILRIYAADTDGGRFYVVEDFESAETLRDRLNRDEPLDLAEALHTAASLCEALSYAHSRGICHGGVMPESVVLTPSGDVKLRDFASSGALVRAEVVGWDAMPERVPYLAPEQIGIPSSQPAADIYAVGALLFQMLTGRPPFGNDSPADVSRRIREARPPDVDEFNPEVPAHVVGAVAKALAKRPADRWESAADFADALRVRSEASGPVEATAPMRTVTPAGTSTAATPAVSARDEVSPSSPGPSRLSVAEGGAAPVVEPRGWAQVGAVTSATLRGTFWLLITVAVMVGLVLGMMWQLVAAIPEDRKVPDVVNKPVEEARRMVEARDLTLSITRHEFHAKVPADHVIKMSPYPGKTVKQGREVSVIASRGEPLVRMPLLSSMQYDEASKRLKELSLKPKKTGERSSVQVTKGGVVSQWPLAGQEVPKGSEVKLTVSSGRASRRRPAADDKSVKEYVIKVPLPPGDQQRLVHVEAEEDGVPVDKYTRWHKGGETAEYTLRAREGSRVRVFVDEEEVHSERLR